MICLELALGDHITTKTCLIRDKNRTSDNNIVVRSAKIGYRQCASAPVPCKLWTSSRDCVVIIPRKLAQYLCEARVVPAGAVLVFWEPVGDGGIKRWRTFQSIFERWDLRSERGSRLGDVVEGWLAWCSCHGSSFVHCDCDMFFSLTRLNLLHPNLGRAGLKRPAAMLSSPSRLNYEALFVVLLKMITWCVFVFDESKVELL